MRLQFTVKADLPELLIHIVLQNLKSIQDATGIACFRRSSKDAGQNGVWVMSSLQISTMEQISFMRKTVNRQLAVSAHAYDMTEDITRYESEPDGWNVHGKTGTGSPGTDNKYDSAHTYGWYVG